MWTSVALVATVMKMQLALIRLEATFVPARKGILETQHFAKVRTRIIVRIEGPLRATHGCQKRSRKKVQIRNNLVPVFCNRSQTEIKTKENQVSQKRLKRLQTSIEGSVLR